MVRVFWIILVIVINQASFAQISGLILSGETNIPLVGATVSTGNETVISKEDGSFLLNDNASKIIISYVGYRSDTLIASDTARNYIIYLMPSISLIDPVIIRANFNTYPINQMPSSVGYIPDLRDQDQDVINFVGNLNQVPGVFSQVGANNTNRITIRGIGSRTPYSTNRIKAYYNDIPLTSGDGSTEIENINVSAIGSVDILKGSKSALYGSGLGGVIILNKPVINDGFSAEASVTLASYKTIKAQTGIQYRKNGVYIDGDYSKAVSDGWRDNSQYSRDNFLLNTGIVRSKSHLDLTVLAISTKAHIPSSLNKDTYEKSPQSAAKNWLGVVGFEQYKKLIVGIRYNYLFSDKVKNRTNIFMILYDGYESRPFNILDDASDTYGFRNITELQFYDLKLQIGFETLFENYKWSVFETNGGYQGQLQNKFSEKRVPFSIFLNAQYIFGNNAVIEAGLSTNTLYYRLTDEFDTSSALSGDFRYKTIISPFLGVNLPLNKSVKLYSSLSHGFSAPSVEETLLPEGNINPDLRPETGINLEFGVRFNSVNNKITADACVYKLWVNDLLVTKRETEEVFYGINAGSTQHTGAEISTNVTLVSKKKRFPVILKFNYNYIHARFTDFVDDNIDYTNNELPGIPRQNLWATVEVSSSLGALVSIQYQYVGKQYLNDSNDEQYGNFQIFNLMAGYKINFVKSELMINMGIRNVFNAHYASMVLVNAPSFGGSLPRYYYPGMPRNYFVNLKFRL